MCGCSSRLRAALQINQSPQKVFDTALGHGRVAVGAPPPNPNPLLINLEVCLTLGINITKFHYSFVGFPYLNGFVLYILRYNNFYKVTRDYK